MERQLKCPKCWHIADYDLARGDHTLFRGKLAIRVRCKKCGMKLYAKDELLLDAMFDDR